MPAAVARARPAAPGRFEITTAMRALSSPARDRLDERLQVAAATGNQHGDARRARAAVTGPVAGRGHR